MEIAARPYVIPRSQGRASSLALAVAMHCLLALMLILGLSWHSTTPEVINAELWSALPQMAAPRVEPARPAVVEPVKPAIEAPPEPVPVTRADITIKQETPKKPPPARSEPTPAVEPIPKPIVKPPPQPVTPQTAAKPSDLAYIQRQLTQEGKGSASQTSGSAGDDKYKARLIAKIRSNMRFPPPPGSVGNPTATLIIEQLPTGEVTRVSIVTSSGLPAFDAAAQRAVEASSPLPKDDQGKVDPSIKLDYRLFENRPPE